MGSQLQIPLPISHPVLQLLARNWWLVLLRGVVVITFGIMAIAIPGITLVTLVFMVGGLALIDGALALAAAVCGGRTGSRWWLACAGLSGISIGLTTFVWPNITALFLLVLIACWAIAIGVFQIIGAIELNKEIDNEWYLIFSGAMSLGLGLAFLVYPGQGALALLAVIGVYAMICGVFYIMLALRLRKHAHS